MLYECKTTYNQRPPTDVNPLILQKYTKAKFFVLCAREGMKIRISKLLEDPSYLGDEQTMKVMGWWEIDDNGWEISDLYDDLLESDIVVIIGKDRIDPRFYEYATRVYEFFGIEDQFEAVKE